MNEQEFSKLATQGYNRIPLMREVLADLDTPLSTYLKLADGPYSYLFESVQGGEKWGRYSIIGLPCRKLIRIHEQQVQVYTDNIVIEEATVEDPLAWIEDFYGRYKIYEQDNFLVHAFAEKAVSCIRFGNQRPSGNDSISVPTCGFSYPNDI